MLKGIHPFLHPDLLHVLASMGHGDELVIADANFPSATNGKRLVQLAVPSTTVALEAIITLFPVDASATPPAMTMKVPGDVAELLEATRELAALLARVDPPVKTVGLDRQDFYARARNAFAVVRTADLRRFANVILVKGVVNRYPRLKRRWSSSSARSISTLSVV
jgi:L-fucose mutarotase